MSTLSIYQCFTNTLQVHPFLAIFDHENDLLVIHKMSESPLSHEHGTPKKSKNVYQNLYKEDCSIVLGDFFFLFAENV